MKKIIDMLEKIQLGVGVFFLIGYLLCTFLQIITRYVAFLKFPWTEEIANYCFIWSAFMGAAVMLREGGHFCLTAVPDFLKKHHISTMPLTVVIYLLLLLFGVLMLYYGIELTVSFATWKLCSLPTVSQLYVWLCLPVTGFTMSIYSLEGVVIVIRMHGKGA